MQYRRSIVEKTCSPRGKWAFLFFNVSHIGMGYFYYCYIPTFAKDGWQLQTDFQSVRRDKMISSVGRLALAIVITAVLVFGGLLAIDHAFEDAEAGYHHATAYHDQVDPDTGYVIHQVTYPMKWN